MLLKRNTSPSLSPYVSPYIVRALIRAKRLELELRNGDLALDHDRSPSRQDNEAADSTPEASSTKLR